MTVPYTPIEDTTKKKSQNCKQKQLYVFSTPQIFKYKLFKNNIGKINNDPTDDYGVIEKNKITK